MNDKELKSIRINKEVHKKLKIFCSENDLKINSLIENIILEYIKKRNKNDINREIGNNS